MMGFGFILPIITLPSFAEPQKKREKKYSIDLTHKQEN